jgi:hypothetical protein
MKKGKNAVMKKNKKRRFSSSEAGLAFKHGFYLETVWILSVIFERKTKNYLSLIDSKYDVRSFTFEQCLRRMKFLQGSGRIPAIGKYIEIALMEGMHKWKNTRNKMFKDMVLVHVSQTRMERVALEGIELYKNWNKGLKSSKKEIKNQTLAEEGKSHEGS